jgi:hypothetical protein
MADVVVPGLDVDPPVDVSRNMLVDQGLDEVIAPVLRHRWPVPRQHDGEDHWKPDPEMEVRKDPAPVAGEDEVRQDGQEWKHQAEKPLAQDGEPHGAISGRGPGDLRPSSASVETAPPRQTGQGDERGQQLVRVALPRVPEEQIAGRQRAGRQEPRLAPEKLRSQTKDKEESDDGRQRRGKPSGDFADIVAREPAQSDRLPEVQRRLVRVQFPEEVGDQERARSTEHLAGDQRIFDLERAPQALTSQAWHVQQKG